MTIVFFSNYLTHHQEPFCRELQKLKGVDFTFIADKPIKQKRLKLGYKDLNQYPYVLRAYENEMENQKAEKLCEDCDILICGNGSDALMVKRAESGKPLIIFSERLFKQGVIHAFSPRVIKRMIKTHLSFKKYPVYLLCAGAFAFADYRRYGAYRNKAYKWGYFPEVKRYEDINTIISKKKSTSILWAGRLINWKHPEHAIAVAERLKRDGYRFTLEIIGNGALEEKLQKEVAKKGLNDCVVFCGAMSPDQVREHMERSEIFLFTSNRQEGWGAVLNESMNSGCAVVASRAIGAIPFLIKDGENGLCYKSCNVDDLYNKVRYLLENTEQRNRIGEKAYETIATLWNAETAAQRLVQLCEKLLQGEKRPDLYEEGPCSRAEKIKDNWY